MRIHILSDLHFEFQRWRKVWDLRTVNADLHVLAGDIGVGLSGIQWALNAFTKPVIYVMGNHEHYGQRPMEELIHKAREKATGTHVHFLENDCVVIDGVRFLGCTLWTDFALFGAERRQEMMDHAAVEMSDYANIHVSRKGGRPNLPSVARSDKHGQARDRLTPTVSLALHHESRSFLEQKLDSSCRPGVAAESWTRTVVVSHHAPTALSQPSDEPAQAIDAAYASNLDDLVAQSDLWLHGHVHTAACSSIGGTPVVTNCRGYKDAGPYAVRGFDPFRVVEI